MMGRDRIDGGATFAVIFTPGETAYDVSRWFDAELAP